MRGGLGGRGKILGGFVCCGKDFDYLVNLGELQDAVDHALWAGEAHRAAGLLELREAFHDLADGGAIDMVDCGEIEDEAFLAALGVIGDFAVEVLAIGAHHEPARQFEYDDSGLDLFL
jgi:hypothetical protein